jgi:hypothetical protein
MSGSSNPADLEKVLMLVACALILLGVVTAII